MSSDPTSRVYSLANETGAWLVINGAKESESGEYACVYSISNDASDEDMEVVWIRIKSKYLPGMDKVRERGAPLPGNDKEN